jgi:hypothetical protein
LQEIANFCIGKQVSLVRKAPPDCHLSIPRPFELPDAAEAIKCLVELDGRDA